jgi:hypothetical protein
MPGRVNTGRMEIGVSRSRFVYFYYGYIFPITYLRSPLG